MREFLDEYLAIVCTEQRGEKKQSWKRKRERVHPILEDRKSGGEFHTLFPRLNDHERICQECFRVLLTVSTRLEARLEWSKPWLLPIYSTQCSCFSSFSHHSKHLWKGPWLEREWRKNSPWMPVYVLSLKCMWFIFYQTMDRDSNVTSPIVSLSPYSSASPSGNWELRSSQWRPLF